MRPRACSNDQHFGRWHRLELLLERWSGPVTAAVYVRSEDDEAAVAEKVQQVRPCHPCCCEVLAQGVSNQPQALVGLCIVGFHTSRRVYLTHYCILQANGIDNRNNVAVVVVRAYASGQAAAYPANSLRNAALDHVQSKLVFILDVDLIPDKGFYGYLQENIGRMLAHGEKTVFTIPAFELVDAGFKNRDESVLPPDQMELMRSLAAKRVQPILFKV